VVAAALIEPEGEPKKLFRVTLPSPLQMQYGARIIIDKEPAISSAFFTCFANGGQTIRSGSCVQGRRSVH